MTEIESIIEGCMHDTPSRLMYAGIEMSIPENVQMLLSEHEIHPNRYILHAETEDFETFQIVHNPYFQGNLNHIDPSKMFEGGWPLLRFAPNLRWMFSEKRSLTTKDGRLFIELTYFQTGFRRYLESVPTILRECGMIFKGKAREGDFERNPSRCW
jgi:hypothetical protein